jgi:hypothetical protein
MTQMLPLFKKRIPCAFGLPATTVIPLPIVAGFSVVGTLAVSAVIKASPIVLIAGHHQIGTGFVLKAYGVPVDSHFQKAPILVFPARQAIRAQQVRPPVKDFIKRVVVPILVERYIARLNRDRLLAETGEPL